MSVCGFTKNLRIWVRSVSPSMVTDIEAPTLGASIMIRSHALSPLAAAMRAELVIGPFAPCAPLVATVLTPVAGAELRGCIDAAVFCGIGADAATILA